MKVLKTLCPLFACAAVLAIGLPGHRLFADDGDGGDGASGVQCSCSLPNTSYAVLHLMQGGGIQCVEYNCYRTGFDGE